MNALQKISWLDPVSILDCGAWCGSWAADAQAVWPHARITCIEGNPACEPFLKERWPSYKIAMLGKFFTSGTYYKQPGTPIGTGNSLYRELTPFFDSPDTEEVDIVPLESLFPEGETFDLIKLDCQGSELDILMGGLEIAKRAKAILLEVPHVEYNQGAPNKEYIDRFMKALGFPHQEVVDVIHRCIPPHDHIQSNILYSH